MLAIVAASGCGSDVPELATTCGLLPAFTCQVARTPAAKPTISKAAVSAGANFIDCSQPAKSNVNRCHPRCGCPDSRASDNRIRELAIRFGEGSGTVLADIARRKPRMASSSDWQV